MRETVKMTKRKKRGPTKNKKNKNNKKYVPLPGIIILSINWDVYSLSNALKY